MSISYFIAFSPTVIGQFTYFLNGDTEPTTVGLILNLNRISFSVILYFADSFGPRDAEPIPAFL